MAKLDVYLFGLFFGSVWSFVIFTLGFCARTYKDIDKIVQLIAQAYIGYESTFKGSLIGALWAFIDGIINGSILGWVINKILFRI